MASKIKKVETVARPYLLTFVQTGQSYPCTSADAQRILDTETVVTASPRRVVLLAADPRYRVVLDPATLGGGPAFVVTREARGQ